MFNAETHTSWLLDNGQIVDPANGIDRIGRLLIHEGKIAAIDPSDGDIPNDAIRIDAHGMIVAPGLIDIGTDLGEPGREEDETISSGCLSAVAGGYSSIACSANTEPAIDTVASVQFIQQKSLKVNQCRVHVIGCVSKDRRGEEMAEIGALVEAGAIALSDMPRPIENTALLKRALEYCSMFDRPLLDHPELLSLTRHGVMHEDMTQLVLGLPPMPAEAEDLATARDLRLVEATGGRLHLTNISTIGSVELCRRAKSRGLPFSVGLNSVNFHLMDQLLRSFDSNCKVNPPLRSAEHLDACVSALADGTIDVIATGHRPFSVEKKMQELDAAPFGMISLETTLSAVISFLIRPGYLNWSDAISKMTCNPAKVLGLTSGTLSVGQPADVVLIDPGLKWKVDAEELLSKASNTPLNGHELFGRSVMLFVDGKLKFTRLAVAV